jgi:hypothetical protein
MFNNVFSELFKFLIGLFNSINFFQVYRESYYNLYKLYKRYSYARVKAF